MKRPYGVDCLSRQLLPESWMDETLSSATPSLHGNVHLADRYAQEILDYINFLEVKVKNLHESRENMSNTINKKEQEACDAKKRLHEALNCVEDSATREKALTEELHRLRTQIREATVTSLTGGLDEKVRERILTLEKDVAYHKYQESVLRTTYERQAKELTEAREKLERAATTVCPGCMERDDLLKDLRESHQRVCDQRSHYRDVRSNREEELEKKIKDLEEKNTALELDAVLHKQDISELKKKLEEKPVPASVAQDFWFLQKEVQERTNQIKGLEAKIKLIQSGVCDLARLAEKIERSF